MAGALLKDHHSNHRAIRPNRSKSMGVHRLFFVDNRSASTAGQIAIIHANIHAIIHL
jgi:hypothetical protein